MGGGGSTQGNFSCPPNIPVVNFTAVTFVGGMLVNMYLNQKLTYAVQMTFESLSEKVES